MSLPSRKRRRIKVIHVIWDDTNDLDSSNNKGSDDNSNNILLLLQLVLLIFSCEFISENTDINEEVYDRMIRKIFRKCTINCLKYHLTWRNRI